MIFFPSPWEHSFCPGKAGFCSGVAGGLHNKAQFWWLFNRCGWISGLQPPDSVPKAKIVTLLLLFLKSVNVYLYKAPIKMAWPQNGRSDNPRLHRWDSWPFSYSFYDPLSPPPPFLLLWTLPLHEKPLFSWLCNELLAGPETWCNAGGNTASEGDLRIISGEPLVEAQMARTMGNIGS